MEADMKHDDIVRARPARDSLTPPAQLDEAFPWHRIRRLARKG
jgi:hypothetical protein